MDLISFLALLLLTLAGFSTGSTIKSRKDVELKPQIIDLILVLIIWGGAISMRIFLGLNKWLLILIWIIIGFVIGKISSSLNELPNKSQKNEQLINTPRNPIVKLRLQWKQMSKQMVSFQSRILISLFYFLIFSPFALAVRIFSDPLKIKRYNPKSHWLPKKEMPSDTEQFRRQF